jgi:23S rRNA (cytosine1962-C5)-methyltransferase
MLLTVWWHGLFFCFSLSYLCSMKSIILKSGKDAPVRRFHPWVFSGAIAKIIGKPSDGEVVEVFDSKQEYLATGHYYEGSITVKIISFGKINDVKEFWFNKINQAYQVRQYINLQETNCYRLIHGEGDSCPGLIIDFYNGVAVFQAHSIGMHLEREHIVEALKQVYGKKLWAIYDKSHETLPTNYAATMQNDYLFGEVSLPHEVLENGNKFLIDWQTGQKTGFFLDQRDNRSLLAKYSKDRKVLNAFCYSGGFSIYALRAGADLVHSVDVSSKAIDLVNKNIQVNGFEGLTHEAYAEDVMKSLKENDQLYDLIVLDPPAFAKSMDARHRAVQGYKRLNMEGFKRLGNYVYFLMFSGCR